MYIGYLVLLIVIALLVLTYLMIRRKSLTCPYCKSHKRIRTGNRKKIDLPNSPTPFIKLYKYNIEYQCHECGKKFWGMIATEDY